MNEADPGPRVILRAERFDRWASGIVDGMMLFLWFFIGLFLVNLLLALAESGLQLPAPPGIVEMVERSAGGERPSGFILIPLAAFTLAWLIGGGRLLVGTLRTLFGSDEVVMHAGQVLVRRTIGPFTWTREWERNAIQSIAIIGRNRRLVAMIGGRRHTVASLGTEDARRRLGADLRTRYGLRTPSAGGGLPDGWESARRADGTLILEPPRAERRSLTGCATAVVIVWMLLLALRFVMKHLREEPLAPTTGDWIAIAVGVLLAVLPFLAALTRETMEVARNSLVQTTTLGSWKRSHALRDANLDLTFHSRHRGGDLYTLQAGSGETWITLGTATNDPANLLLLGRYLAAQTGWPLEVAEQAREPGD